MVILIVFDNTYIISLHSADNIFHALASLSEKNVQAHILGTPRS